MHKYYADLTDEQLLEQFHEHYLRPLGWFASVESREAVDGEGSIPWFTYPAISFLKTVIRPRWRVFEYGAGGSTAWWAKQVATLVSVEHDPEWAAHVQELSAEYGNSVLGIAAEAPEDPEAAKSLEEFFSLGLSPVLTGDDQHNMRSGLLWQPYRAYVSALAQFPPGHFDVIIVDGMARSMAAWLAARMVRSDGMIIFDNSDRDTYRQGFEFLKAAGFARIDFWGPGPINPYAWCTSCFVKSLDVLRES
jgi:hypothetical protein